VAIDLLHDPQALADRLLQRLSKAGEPFLFRLLLLHLVARLVGRHQLQLLNMYPFLLKYLNPKQHEVTQVLACLVESSHSQVSPDELKPVVHHVMHTFVTEAQAPEVIEVGLNSIREVCSRTVNVLTEEELADLCGFRKFKHKGVAMAARSLINTYRELHPQLLHRSLRGREATMAISRGEVQEPQFGDQGICDTIDGLDLLAIKRRQRAASGDEHEDEATSKAHVCANELMTENVLSADDFKHLRKARLQKSIEMQLGRKRKHDDISSSDSEEDEEDSEEDERGLKGRMPDGVSADALRATKKRARTKAERLASVKSGRTDFKEKLIEQRKQRKGGKTNAEQKRNKPLLMSMQSRQLQRKKVMTAKQKVTNLKKHLSTLKKNANHQKRRR